MAFTFTFNEILDLVVMTLLIGYIFMDRFKDPAASYDYTNFNYYGAARFDWNALRFAALATAPAIILHEFGHKFMAMAFGMMATFHAAYMWLVLGVALKLAGIGTIFVVPAFVTWGCPPMDVSCSTLLHSSPWVGSLIAFAGPGVNLLLWLGSWYFLSRNMIPKRYIPLAALTMSINKLLFIFNMIPIPFFDGYSVFSGLLKLIF